LLFNLTPHASRFTYLAEEPIHKTLRHPRRVNPA
jgi:hypothetical protein